MEKLINTSYTTSSGDSYTLAEILESLTSARSQLDNKAGTPGFISPDKPDNVYCTRYTEYLIKAGFTGEIPHQILSSLNEMGLVVLKDKLDENAYPYTCMSLSPNAGRISEQALDLQEQKERQFRERLQGAEHFMLSRVLGQEEPIRTISRAVKRHYGAPVKPKKPLVIVALGPTGVGKTETARRLQEFLTGNAEDMLKIDLGNMKAHEATSWSGAAPSYVGREAGSLFAKALKDADAQGKRLVVLFDEVEKAEPEVLDELLAPMDDGNYRIKLDGSVVSFNNHIIMFTSNKGSSEYQEAISRKLLGFRTSHTQQAQESTARNAQVEAFHKWVRPEFLNRVDEVVVYNGLSTETRRDIAAQKLDDYIREFETGHFKGRLDFENRDVFIAFLNTQMAQSGSHKQGGRQSNSMIDLHLGNPITEFLINNDIYPGSAAHIKATFIQTSKDDEPLDGHLEFTLLSKQDRVPKRLRIGGGNSADNTYAQGRGVAGNNTAAQIAR